MKPNECAYGPETPPTHKVTNYWRGAARDRLGPDMLLCANHAAWYNVIHSDAATPIKRRRNSRQATDHTP